MQKKFKALIQQTHEIGLKPLNSQEISFQKQASFSQFVTKIKEKFEKFSPDHYFLYLPLLNGALLTEGSFQQYLQVLATDPRYSKVGIQKMQANFKLDSDQAAPIKEDDQEYGNAFSKKSNFEENDNWLTTKIEGNPSDNFLKVSAQDLSVFQHLKIITKAPAKLKTMQQLKQTVKRAIVKHLTIY